MRKYIILSVYAGKAHNEFMLIHKLQQFVKLGYVSLNCIANFIYT